MRPSPVEVVAIMHDDIRKKLEGEFQIYPPHTMQRIAELILWPRREYQFLPPFLQALYRTVHVSSDTSMFPLPNVTLPGVSGVFINGHVESLMTATDECLGGAQLTPIPWLTDRSPSMAVSLGAMDSEQQLDDNMGVHVNGDEQSSAGASRVDAPGRAGGGMAEMAFVAEVAARAGAVEPQDDADEVPHARGPADIGIEDTGTLGSAGGIASIMRRSQRSAGHELEMNVRPADDDASMEVDAETEVEATVEAEVEAAAEETETAKT
jgi:hypothetical protein